ncbi:hypothetical protein Poli38472_002883 [Pythium oligandrum]|uniref:Uncharacterized protein n=1 Tax=Pythium oligandrum TaxID=41045 RepID=A0A8K1C5T8_PYTOL|nr:hypothetical protein Poli38472_002883 [Pythium oligandrum]|eukprot:TMW56958.1 hypothetical protein Poli38472_002883 [Pythium oligandrum]
MVMPRMHADDDEFFRDLADSGEKESKHKEKGKTHEDQPSDQSFSSYAYSSSTVFDEHGRRITTVRRRYEDSTGRLKAIHEREIDGKKLKSVWKRKQKSDQGVHKTICSSTSPEEFEEEWKKTPFGQAQGRHESKAKGLEETEKVAEHTTPGPDYEAAEAAPDKECGKEAEGVTKEAHDRTRDDAIAQGSKTQEEETTPPAYS